MNETDNRESSDIPVPQVNDASMVNLISHWRRQARDFYALATADHLSMAGSVSMHSILKFFQVDRTGMFRMTASARYVKHGVGSSRPNGRGIMCFLECPKANTSCTAWVKCCS